VSTYLISGASGLIGFRLVQSLTSAGHRVVPLVRRQPSSQHSVSWDPERGQVDVDGVRRVAPEVVVNLAGEPIAQRWTPARRRRIRESRVNGTRALAAAIAEVRPMPRAFVSGSAIGYYGAHRGDVELDERSESGTDFLAETARDWERATRPAEDAGVRVVQVRTGIVLAREGGALARLLLPFRLGIGGRIGDGQQWMSWIALDDVVHAIRFMIDTPSLSGAVNLVAPNPVRNTEFTRAIGTVLRRPTILPVPAAALELWFGTMASNTILASQRVHPRRLTDAGYQFRHPMLDDALRYELRR